jgi:two-component system response regulator HydG
MAVRILHAASARAERALVKLACAALPENLLESELFGHERGAFTGADRAREGRFEVADGGILFFDDVDTLSLAVQAKLLRALQEGEVQRLGSNTVRKVDVRIVATTNRDLEEEVRAGRFREDLYYRLAVVPIRLPPLREREGDIPILVEHLVRTEAQRLGREVREVASEALAEMAAYDWPGNVRELRNVVERAIVLETGPILHLPGPLGGAGPKDAAPSRISPDALARGAVGAAPLKELLREYKRALIETALRNEDGNLSRAAEVLGLHRPSLSRMVRDLGLRDD